MKQPDGEAAPCDRISDQRVACVECIGNGARRLGSALHVLQFEGGEVAEGAICALLVAREEGLAEISQRAIEVRPGLRVELVAAELPLVVNERTRNQIRVKIVVRYCRREVVSISINVPVIMNFSW